MGRINYVNSDEKQTKRGLKCEDTTNTKILNFLRAGQPVYIFNEEEFWLVLGKRVECITDCEH
jgi:hypothetical protein